MALRASIGLSLSLCAAGCASEETCSEPCVERAVIALEAELWRDGLHEINAIYTIDDREHEVWCRFTLPDAADAGCSIDPVQAEVPTLEVGDTVFLTIPGTPPSIELTLFDAYAYIEEYALTPDYVESGCTGRCRVALLSAAFAEPQAEGAAP